MTQRRPNVAHLRMFDSPAWVYIERRNGKLSDKATKGMFVGYAPNSPVYTVLFGGKETVVESRNPPSCAWSRSSSLMKNDGSDDAAGEQTGASATSGADAVCKMLVASRAAAAIVPTSGASVATQASAAADAPGGFVTRFGHTQERATCLNYTRPGVSELANVCREGDISDNVSNVSSEYLGYLNGTSDLEGESEFDGYVDLGVRTMVEHRSGGDGIEPKSYKEAMLSKLACAWRAAMNEEYKALMERGTFKLGVLPSGVKAVTAKWVYKIKRLADGSIDKYKAWVARGFTQGKGVNYNTTFGADCADGVFSRTCAEGGEQRLANQAAGRQVGFHECRPGQRRHLDCTA